MLSAVARRVLRSGTRLFFREASSGRSSSASRRPVVLLEDILKDLSNDINAEAGDAINVVNVASANSARPLRSGAKSYDFCGCRPCTPDSMHEIDIVKRPNTLEVEKEKRSESGVHTPTSLEDSFVQRVGGFIKMRFDR